VDWFAHQRQAQRALRLNLDKVLGVDIPPAQMARGNSRAQSELPSGIEASRNDIQAYEGQAYAAASAAKYSSTWEKTATMKVSAKGFKFGDGEVGNGIIKNGELHLRDEDIAEIVDANFVYDQLKETIREGGGGETEFFAPFTGKNNLADKDDLKDLVAFNVEITSQAHDYPDGTDLEVTDFERGASNTQYEPGYDASGSLAIPDGSSASNWVKVDYDNVMARAAGAGERPITMERSSAQRLSKAIEARINQAGAGVAESAAEDFDFEEHEQDARNDYESERERDYD